MSVATALRTLFTLSLAWSLAIESVRGKLSNGLGSVLIYLWSLWSYAVRSYRYRWVLHFFR